MSSTLGGFKEETYLRWFWQRVDKTGPCWLWTGSLDYQGYGSLTRHHVRLRVHRYSYELLVGPIPEGMVLDHICRVRNCVNPDHLRPLDNVENVMIGVSPAAINARKTHCKHGHRFSAENTRISREGFRICRACARATYLRAKGAGK